MLEVLVIFVAVAIGGDVGASFGIPNILHLVRVVFDADFAEVPQGTRESRHVEGGVKERFEVFEGLNGGDGGESSLEGGKNSGGAGAS